MKQLKLRYVAIFLLLLMLCSGKISAQESAQYTADLLKAGDTAPEFSLTTPNGETVRLSDFKNRYVVLDFWASWCPDCRRDAPEVVKAYRLFKDKNITFVGISFDTDKENWKNAITKFDMEYPQISELKKWKETNISNLYKIKWIPTLYLIGPDGKIVYTTIHVSEMIQKLQDLL